MKPAKGNQNIAHKKSVMSFGVEESLKSKVEARAAETGASKSELGRRALEFYLDGNCNDGQVMLNCTLLTQLIQDLKADIQEKDYQMLQQYINNIMILKGGAGHGNI